MVIVVILLSCLGPFFEVVDIVEIAAQGPINFRGGFQNLFHYTIVLNFIDFEIVKFYTAMFQ